MSYSRRSALRYVCGQTIDPTAMIYTFLESPTNLDVHHRKRFALFGQNRRNWRRRSRHLKQRNLLFCGGTIYSPTLFLHLLHLFTLCWYTGDNVRLSDVVKFFSFLAWVFFFAKTCFKRPCNSGISARRLFSGSFTLILPENLLGVSSFKARIVHGAVEGRCF